MAKPLNDEIVYLVRLLLQKKLQIINLTLK